MASALEQCWLMGNYRSHVWLGNSLTGHAGGDYLVKG